MDEYEVTLEGYQPVWTTVLVKANGRNDAESRAMDQRNWLDEEVEWEKGLDESPAQSAGGPHNGEAGEDTQVLHVQEFSLDLHCLLLLHFNVF